MTGEDIVDGQLARLRRGDRRRDDQFNGKHDGCAKRGFHGRPFQNDVCSLTE
jgi:hypothetical protein